MHKIQEKLSQLSVPDSTCSQSAPAPLLFSLYTNSCTSSHQFVKLLKFTDDTTLIRLISDGDESAYRTQPHLPPSPSVTPQLILWSPSANLGTIISQDLKWELNISSLIKKAQQRMYFLRQLKKFNLPRTMMVHFYSSIIESILTSSITIWYAAATVKDKGRLQRVIRSAEKVIGCNLPSLQDLYASRTLRHAGKIVADPSHPGHKLFETLPSGRRLWSIRTKTSQEQFFPIRY
ncbi:hypothetical protein N1851_002697 [Merluccius polli]|uniref:Alkylated DNA repair protein AlkB homologue 8 N-terminal domain-containing protein n=1 Tax=Merluccius polli TaxID=89951 RepID=A0AA47N9Y7_MERPO|nr:hypothetical protein N1851_002697 [Merluccius polli]